MIPWKGFSWAVRTAMALIGSVLAAALAAASAPFTPLATPNPAAVKLDVVSGLVSSGPSVA